MAVNLVLDNGNFPSVNANVLVAAGARLGSLGLATSGTVTAGGLSLTGGTVEANNVEALFNVADGARLQNTLQTNGGGTFRVMGNGVGSQTQDNAYYTNAQQVNYQAPAWNATYDYGPPHNNVLIVYGTNTAAVGDYPNNIFYSTGAPVVGVPPTLTPAPYPAGGGVPSVGWALAKDGGLLYGGATVVGGTGNLQISETICQGGYPGLIRFFGGGGESVGGAVPRGMDLTEAGISATANNNNGALLDLAGVMKADGVYIHNGDSALSPASSANALFIPPSANGFVLGNNYTWTAPTPPATAWHWVGAAGTAGSMTLSGPATSMAFDVNCMVMLTPVTVGATAAGSIGLSNKASTSITIDSRDAAGAVLAGDVRSIEWIVFNPNWTT
jgi:hypothetical protein